MAVVMNGMYAPLSYDTDLAGEQVAFSCYVNGLGKCKGTFHICYY